MSSKKKTSKKPMTTAEDVDQIREIIFGGQMRDYDSRFKILQEELQAITDSMRADFQRRVETLNKSLKTSNDEISSSFNKEQSARRDTAQSIQDEISSLKANTQADFDHLENMVEQKTKQLTEHHENTQQDLDQRLSHQIDSIKKRFDHQIAELTERKVSREELAGLLTEVALRLKGDFNLPTGSKDK